MHAVRATLPIGPARLAHVPHINPRPPAALHTPLNTGDNDNGGQSGYIISPGAVTGDGSIYVAMTAYDDAWVTTPTDGSYNTVNAPTTHGPNGNCIETVTNYYNGFGTPGTTVDQIQFYDFCTNGGQGGFVGAEPIDADFVRDYVRVYSGSSEPLPRYISAVIHSSTDKRWHAYLYNATLMHYVDVYDSGPNDASNVLGGEGWSIFETHYNGGNCTTLPDVSTEALQIRTTAGWQPLTTDNAYSYQSGTCYDPPLSPPYYVPVYGSTPSLAWTVTTVAPPTVSEYARTVIADAPAAYYRLGENGTHAYDSSGNGLLGLYGANVVHGEPSLLAVESSNGAAGFPGGPSSSANIVSVAPAAGLQPAQSVSVEAWIALARPNTSGTVDIVSYGAQSAAQPYSLQLLANGTAGATIVTSNGPRSVAGTTVLAAQKPYFVDATYDGSQLAVYVDGELDATAAASGTLSYGSASASDGLTIGSAFATSRQAFAGTIDEVAVFAHALASAQVARHWTAGSGVAPDAASQYAAIVGADAPLAYYRLSDASPVALDASTHHLDAAYGANVRRDVSGLIGTDATNNAAAFSGGTSSPAVAVSEPRSMLLEPPRAVSIEAWIDVPALPSGTVDLVSYGPELLGQPYTLELLANGTIAMRVWTAWGAVSVTSKAVVPAGGAHLIDATNNGTTLTLYLDGQAVATGPANGALSYVHETAPYGLSIGTAFDTKRTAFAGVLDDVAIYGSALPAARVAAHWTAGSGHAPSP
jgi:hypothetical protein